MGRKSMSETEEAIVERQSEEERLWRISEMMWVWKPGPAGKPACGLLHGGGLLTPLPRARGASEEQFHTETHFLSKTSFSHFSF